MTSQSKRNSFIESLTNTFIGMIITLVFSPLIYWICDVEMSWPQMSYAMLLFTVISILRNYVIRRIFERRNKKKHLRFERLLEEEYVARFNKENSDCQMSIKYMTVLEIAEQFPHLSQEELNILKKTINNEN